MFDVIGQVFSRFGVVVEDGRVPILAALMPLALVARHIMGPVAEAVTGIAAWAEAVHYASLMQDQGHHAGMPGGLGIEGAEDGPSLLLSGLLMLQRGDEVLKTGK